MLLKSESYLERGYIPEKLGDSRDAALPNVMITLSLSGQLSKFFLLHYLAAEKACEDYRSLAGEAIACACWITV
eukprot:scaffold103488_cov16-Prasinocladus_malaysianus.AAC.1